jgi:hypothetical protein
MRTIAIALFGIAAACAVSASAAEQKPITSNNPSAVDVAATPAEDLNLRKRKIPPVLTAAEAHPYAIPGGCPAITSTVAELNRTLGPDVDRERSSQGLRAGSVAKSVVSSLIPFGGIIRQVSGAAKAQQELQDAITAGIARRSFLKGYGRAKGCKV